jgi:outer membrane protein assembly factor BamB
VFLLTGIAVVLPAHAAGGRDGQWPQWGGPNRDFTVETTGLAEKWPQDGPRKLWYRELGDGYSSIVVDGGLLYTMHRTGETELTVALDASTGKTVWAHENPSPYTEAMTEFGPGPHATPLVSGDRLFTIGTNAVLHCFDKKSGKVLWKHDLIRDLGGYVFHYGYACSPIAYKNTVIVPVDRRRQSLRRHEHGSDEHAKRQRDHGTNHASAETATAQSLVAFDQAKGEIVWKSQDYKVDYASPILIDVEGQEQIVLMMGQGVMGVCPDCGDLFWHHAIPSNHGGNYTTPLSLGEGLLFCSSSHTDSRMIKLTKKDGQIVPEELWNTAKMRIAHGNAVRFGQYILGSSSSGQGPAFLVALDIRTGKRAWTERGYDTATLIKADGKILLLAEDGLLVLASATPKGLTVHSKCKITERLSWTAPTLVGTTLYVRDRKHVMALDLGS